MTLDPADAEFVVAAARAEVGAALAVLIGKLEALEPEPGGVTHRGEPLLMRRQVVELLQGVLDSLGGSS